jgi:hypothetical protein
MYGVLWAMIASAGAVFAGTPEQQAMYLAQTGLATIRPSGNMTVTPRF